MSWYTIFDEQEALLTSTTTNATLGATDVMIVHNYNTGKKYQIPAGQVGGMEVTTQITTNSTGTNIVPYGFTTFACTGSTAAFLLQAPVGPGFTKILASSTTGVVTVTCSNAVLRSSEAAGGSNIQFLSAGGYCTLISQTSTAWWITGRSTGATLAG